MIIDVFHPLKSCGYCELYVYHTVAMATKQLYADAWTMHSIYRITLLRFTDIHVHNKTSNHLRSQSQVVPQHEDSDKILGTL